MMRPILVIDVEATCWSGDPDPEPPKPEGRRYTGEIIELGCALIDATGRAAGQPWHTYVRPAMNPTLSRFCTELTEITQDQVDAAPHFPAALNAFLAEYSLQRGNDPWFGSWGNFDRHILLDDCRTHGVQYPFALSNHVNLKAEAKRALGLNKRMGLQRALKAIGIAFEGRLHTAVDDVHNIRRIVLEMLRRGWQPPRS